MADITNFKNKWLGRRIDYDHVFSFQCVDLILEYVYENYGLASGVWGNAIDYWTKPTAALLTKFDKVATTDIQAGDIVVLNGLPGNPYGHITIGTGAQTGDQYEGLEQNGQTGNGTGVGGDSIRTRMINKNRIAGVLRPKAPAPAPTPEAPHHPYTVEQIAPKQVVGDVNRQKWNLDQTTWAGMSANPIGTLPAGQAIVVSAIAHHNLGGKYYMDDANNPQGYNVVDLHDYTPPAPQPETPPVPAEPQKVDDPHYTFVRFEQPLNLITNKQMTDLWGLDFATYPQAQASAVLPQGTPFVAVGKAVRKDLDHPVYFMRAEDFGQADVTGQPANRQGINTVDLSPKPADPAPEAAPVVEAPVDGQGDETPAEAAPVAPQLDGDKIQVHVTPPDPNKWKEIDTSVKGEYIAKESIPVHDLSGLLPDQQLVKGQSVPIAGKFRKDGVEYWITEKSAAAGKMYGIPPLCLDEDDSIFDLNLAAELKEELGNLNPYEKAVKVAGSVEGFLTRITHKKK